MKTGVLLSNLGTPDAPTKAALKRYLKEFLADERVIQPKNKLIWWLALNVVILNIRPAKSAQNYAKIWDSFGTGSPLLSLTLLQAQGVEKILTNEFDDLVLEVGMRYGNPSIDSALEKLQAQGCEKIVVLPLYPQYSDTTTASTLDTINKALEKWDDKPKLDFIDHYYTDKGYIQSLALSVVEHQEPLFSSLISSKVSKQSAEKPGQMTCICSTPSCAKVQAQGCEKIVVLPLYPQYSDTTTASTLDTINKALEKWVQHLVLVIE
jgi:ferrochelatase